MATLYISEYRFIAYVPLNGAYTQAPGQAPQEPALVEQTVGITGSSTQSAPFNVYTALVRVHCDAVCSVAFGTNPVAATNMKRLAANQTEYFGVTPGQQLAVIQNV